MQGEYAATSGYQAENAAVAKLKNKWLKQPFEPWLTWPQSPNRTDE
jgi:hypothetical protein